LKRRLALLAAGLRRFLIILFGLAALTTVVSLLLAQLLDASSNRVISIGFDVVGVFLLVAGFFVGNRGPVRLKGQESAPLVGQRRMRWASPREREETLNDSAFFISVGIVMVVIGLAIDSRYPLF